TQAQFAYQATQLNSGATTTITTSVPHVHTANIPLPTLHSCNGVQLFAPLNLLKKSSRSLLALHCEYGLSKFAAAAAAANCQVLGTFMQKVDNLLEL
ncbi:unnamed protein product, partial [Ceratitis capitata]